MYGRGSQFQWSRRTLIYTIKAKLLAMSFNEPKPTLNAAIDKIIWNLRSTKKSSNGCSPFSKQFNRSPNTFWKSLVSQSVRSRVTAQNWGEDDTIEDDYLDNTVADKMGYESDPTDKPDLSLYRTPLSNPFSQGSNWFRKTINRREGDPYFKPFVGKPLSDTTHTVTLDNEHVLRKSDLAFKKINHWLPVNFQQFLL